MGASGIKRACLESVIPAVQDPPAQPANKAALTAPPCLVTTLLCCPGSSSQNTSQEERPVEEDRRRAGAIGEARAEEAAVGLGTEFVPKKFRGIDSEWFPLFRGRKCSLRGIPSSAEEPILKL